MSKGQNVGDVYTATLERIRAQGEDRARLGMEAIMWIAYSERPLGPDELCQALGVEIGSTDLDNDNAPSIRTILNCGLGLVTVDSSSSKARLVHFTLQEHIIANPTLFCSPHSIIAEVCLIYLNFRCIRDLPPTLRSLPPTTPFLEYASLYWGAHARRQTSTNVISLALDLLDGFDTHISCWLLLRQEYSPALFLRGGRPGPSNYTMLHIGVLLGVPEIMTSLLKTDKWGLNATDEKGRTALICAAEMGHDAIMKVLLQEGVNPHIIDHHGRTLLSWAAGNGYQEILEMLLERNDTNPDRADKSGRTPLSWAAESGREKIVRTLLARGDVNPDTADNGGQTPLAWAAGAGLMSRDTEEEHERVVKILLERNDVNPDNADKNGQTPLSWAAMRGFAGVLRMLLERNDVNPDRADKNGRTPLSWAAGPGFMSRGTGEEHGRVVRILLERNDVNPDSADENGRTPLSWAAQSGFVGVLQNLLERNDVSPDSADKNGRTPLSWAAEGGSLGTLWMLFERNGINLDDFVDKSGRRLFSRARTFSQGFNHRWGEAVRILLERNDVNPHKTDTSDRTPLDWAIEGHYAYLDAFRTE